MTTIREENAAKKMKAWCEKNYTKGADTMIECWSKQDYIDTYNEHGGILKNAMRTLRSCAAIYRDRYAEANSYRDSW
jgi:hypothetical protein